jgi:hypothetical protein
MRRETHPPCSTLPAFVLRFSAARASTLRTQPSKAAPFLLRSILSGESDRQSQGGNVIPSAHDRGHSLVRALYVAPCGTKIFENGIK